MQSKKKKKNTSLVTSKQHSHTSQVCTKQVNMQHSSGKSGGGQVEVTKSQELRTEVWHKSSKVSLMVEVAQSGRGSVTLHIKIFYAIRYSSCFQREPFIFLLDQFCCA